MMILSMIIAIYVIYYYYSDDGDDDPDGQFVTSCLQPSSPSLLCAVTILHKFLCEYTTLLSTTICLRTLKIRYGWSAISRLVHGFKIRGDYDDYKNYISLF